MVNAVGFIYWIANFLLGSAVEVIIQTVSIVTGLITLAVVKSTPAVRICTVGPRIHCQRAVASIPAARKCVTLLITNAVIVFAVTVCQRARRCLGLHHALLTAFARPATGTLAVEEWEAGLFCAQSSIPARLGGAAFIAAVLTLGSTITWQARATCPSCGKSTASSIIAGQLTAGHASFAVRPGITKLTCARVAHAGAAGQGTSASILAWLRLTNTESALTSPTCEAWLADTLVVIGQLDAVETVGGTAGVGEALIYVTLTSFSCETRGAIAAVAAHSVHTSAIIQALRSSTAQPHGWSAVIFVNFTENS